MNQSPPRNDSKHTLTGSPAVARRGGSGDRTGQETYDSENLPVLIRLPALANTAPVPGGAVAHPPTPPGPHWVRGGSAPDRSGAARSAVRRRQGRPRDEREPRWPTRAVPVRGWLRGLGRFVMAAVMAGVLLSIIIMVRDAVRGEPSTPAWKHDSRGQRPPLQWEPPAAETVAESLSGRNADAAGAVDGTEPVWDLGPTFQQVPPAMLDAPAAGPALESDWDRSPNSAPRFNARRIPEGTGYADGVETSALPVHYPSTGMEPVSSPSGPIRHASSEGWRETVPLGTPGGADRVPTEHRSWP
jgi:hypothetical protein